MFDSLFTICDVNGPRIWQLYLCIVPINRFSMGATSALILMIVDNSLLDAPPQGFHQISCTVYLGHLLLLRIISRSAISLRYWVVLQVLHAVWHRLDSIGHQIIWLSLLDLMFLFKFKFPIHIDFPLQVVCIMLCLNGLFFYRALIDAWVRT